MNVDAKPSRVYELSAVSTEGSRRIAWRTSAEIHQVMFFSDLIYPGDVALHLTHIKYGGPSTARISYLGTTTPPLEVTDRVVIDRGDQISIVKYVPNGQLINVAETITLSREGVQWVTDLNGPEEGSDVATAIDLDRYKRILKQSAIRLRRGL